MIAVKLSAFVATGSVSLLTSLIDGGVDAIASGVTFLGVRYAERPADLAHRYGHGKGEALAALLQAVFLAGAAVVLVAESAHRLVDPEPLQKLDLGVYAILASLVATTLLVAFQGFVVRRTGSTAIAADRAHYATDVAVNIAVLAALILTRETGWWGFDPLFGIGISLFMAYGAASIARHATDTLLDRELPRGDRERIRSIVLDHAEARGVHDLRTRNSGDRVFIEFHLEVDGALTVAEGHRIADEIERSVCDAFKNAEVLVHQEPAGIDDERLDRRLARHA